MNEQEQTNPNTNIQEKLEELFSDEDVGNVIVIYTQKDLSEPQLWRRGHFYDITVLKNQVLTAYKQKALVELGLHV
jgi:hypothetical protein